MWGARAFAPKSGQDHLGLGSVSSDRILPVLSPGINVLTIHPRYWSFYAWVLDDFWGASLPRTRGAFRDFYRPREALFSMACHVCDAPEHATLRANIVGSRLIGPKSQDPEFDPQFDYIKEPLGGYGLYYRTTMEQMGVLVVARPDNGFPIDAPTPAGRALAAAFRDAVHGTQVSRMLSMGETTKRTPREALVEFARSACLCQLRVSGEHDLPLLTDLFLHSGVTEYEPRSRRETMRMLLDLSSCCPSRPIAEDEFRQLVYYRELDGSMYMPMADLGDVARRWRVYQGREYFAYVFNRLLRWVSRRGLAATDGGLTALAKSAFRGLVAEALDKSVDEGDKGLALPAVSASTPAANVLTHLRGRHGVEYDANSVWPRHHDMDEHAFYLACSSDEDDGVTLIALLAMILLLGERFGVPQRAHGFADEQILLAEGGSLRIGMSRFMSNLNQRMLAQPSLAELANWLIEDFVIVQHERVAVAKLPDDTYRVRRVGDALRFFAQEVPATFSDSRFNALSTTVHELGWVDSFRQSERQLTRDGRALLRSGDLPAGAMAKAISVISRHGSVSP